MNFIQIVLKFSKYFQISSNRKRTGKWRVEQPASYDLITATCGVKIVESLGLISAYINLVLLSVGIVSNIVY
jgi:hypothetical protein